VVGRVKRSREGQRENKVGGEEEVVVQLQRAESRSCRVGECRGVVCREEEKKERTKYSDRRSGTGGEKRNRNDGIRRFRCGRCHWRAHTSLFTLFFFYLGEASFNPELLDY
jgi:hypothetical protein